MKCSWGKTGHKLTYPNPDSADLTIFSLGTCDTMSGC